MNRLFIILILILNCINHTSCKKDDNTLSTSPNPCLSDCDDKPLFEVVWTKPINNKKNNYSNLQPFIYNNSIIFGSMPESEDNEIIYSFDKVDGTKNWQWSDYFTLGPNFTKKIGVWNNLGSISYTFRDYVINLDNGQTLWRYETPLGTSTSPRGTLIGDWIYHPQEIEGSFDDTIAYMSRTKIDNPNWEIVYTLKADTTGAGVNLEPPTIGFNANGDSILIFQRRSFNFVKQDNRQDLIAYNLKFKKEEWRKDFIDYPNISSAHPILIKNNIVMYLGHGKVYGININNGNILWTYSVPSSDFNNFATASAIISGNYLVVKTSGEYMFCVNINTGSKLWATNLELSDQHSNLILYKSKIYFTVPEKMYCINVSNGEVIFRYRSPNIERTDNYGRFYGYGGLVIDPTTDLMYFADSYYINCVKVRK